MFPEFIGQLKQRALTGVEDFKRKRMNEFEHFTEEDVTFVNAAVYSIVKFLQERIGNTYGVEEYIRTS